VGLQSTSSHVWRHRSDQGTTVGGSEGEGTEELVGTVPVLQGRVEGDAAEDEEGAAEAAEDEAAAAVGAHLPHSSARPSLTPRHLTQL